MSALEAEFEIQLRAMKIAYKKEQKLVPGRRYRWDFVCLDVAIECQGGTWIKGAHSTGTGIQRDCDKLFEVVALGYKPLNITASDIKSGVAVQRLLTLLRMKD
jgi:hypothetical protein